MKKFHFALDSVLNYRRQVLDGLQGEYAQALDQVRRQGARKAAAEKRYQDLNRRFHEEAAEGITIADAMGYESGLRVLEKKIAQEAALLQEYRKAAEAKQTQVIKAHIDTTALDRLREKQLQTYRSELQKNDERFIDELVSAARCGQSS